MKVSIRSGSHNHIPLLDAAGANARTAGTQAEFHRGDVAAPSTLGCLHKYGLPTRVIHGSNPGDLCTLGRSATRPGSVVRYHGMNAAMERGGRRTFLVHYPRYARAMAATTGERELACCGHRHQAGIERLQNLKGTTTAVVDPGTGAGVGQAAATWLLGDLSALGFEVHAVDKSRESQAG